MLANLAAMLRSNAEGETDRVVDGASPSEGSAANSADGKCGWVTREGLRDNAAPLAQMPALRPTFCDARSSRSASVGDTRAEEESRLTDKCSSGQEHAGPPEAS